MDAIRKKMKSLKSETDQLNTVIKKFEDETRDAVARAEQADLDIRDYGKKCSKLEFDFDETNEKLVKARNEFQYNTSKIENCCLLYDLNPVSKYYIPTPIRLYRVKCVNITIPVHFFFTLQKYNFRFQEKFYRVNNALLKLTYYFCYFQSSSEKSIGLYWLILQTKNIFCV